MHNEQNNTLSIMQTMWKQFINEMTEIETVTQKQLTSLDETYRQMTNIQQEDLEVFRQKINSANQVEQKKQTNIDYMKKLEEEIITLLNTVSTKEVVYKGAC